MESDRPEHNEMPATAVRDVGETPVVSVASEAPAGAIAAWLEAVVGHVRRLPRRVPGGP